MTVCNLKELATKLGCSQNHVYKLIKLGMPYHQLSPKSRRYYIYEEVLGWLKTAGFNQKKVWC